MAGNQSWEGRTATNLTTGERVMRKGGKWVPIAPAPGGLKLTEGQAKDGFNAKRLMTAGKTISDIEAGGYDAGGNLLPGWLLFNDKKRKYEAAEGAWSDAMLRLTSGAQAPKEEMEATRKTYFPIWGDSEEVRRLKAEMRSAAERDAAFRSGPGALPSAGVSMTGSAARDPARPGVVPPPRQASSQVFQTPAGTVTVRPR